MGLPVRINPEVQIVEDHPDSDRYGNLLDTARYELLTLHQVLHGVIGELTWHGAGVAREAQRREVEEAAREAREHPERLVELDVEELKDRLRGDR